MDDSGNSNGGGEIVVEFGIAQVDCQREVWVSFAKSKDCVGWNVVLALEEHIMVRNNTYSPWVLLDRKVELMAFWVIKAGKWKLQDWKIFGSDVMEPEVAKNLEISKISESWSTLL